MKNYERVQKAIEYYISEFKNQPTVANVASHIGVSESHFKRIFKEWAGVSPKKFLSVITAEYAKSKLSESQSVLDTTFETGLSSQGRLYDHTITLYGMTPGEMKTGGSGLNISYGTANSPFGKLILFLSKKGISRMDFMDKDESSYVSSFIGRWPNCKVEKNQKLIGEIAADIFDRKSTTELKIHTLGTNFELNVWMALIKLSPGTLVSYGQLAKHLKKPQSHRAVANAIGKNPVAYIIPCHRVIRESGAIGGYRWGTTRKYAIQALEALRCIDKGLSKSEPFAQRLTGKKLDF